MHPEADALLDAIFDNPDDDTPRLVYADWLQEHDQEALGEFIRLQCAIAPLMNDNPNRVRLREQEKKVWSLVRKRWASFFEKTKVTKDWFHRGMLKRQLSLDGPTFFNCYPEWWPFPVTDLSLDYCDTFADEVTVCPWLLSRVWRLWIRRKDHDLPPALLVQLARHPKLRHLRYVSIAGVRVTRAALKELASSHWIAGIQELSLCIAVLPDANPREYEWFEYRSGGADQPAIAERLVEDAEKASQRFRE